MKVKKRGVTMRCCLLWVGMSSFLGIIILAAWLLTDQSQETEVRPHEISQAAPKQQEPGPPSELVSIAAVVPALEGSSLASSDIEKDHDIQSGTASAWGSVSTSYGDIVANETIRLISKSANRAYSEISDENGHFNFRKILPASDYQLSVSPKGMYKRIAMDSLVILTNEGALSIVLEPLELAKLKGKVVNVEGIAVSGYEMRIQSPLKARWVRKIVPDIIGEFEIENVPVGPIVFTKTFGQVLMITGHEFLGESQTFIELIVDVGYTELKGVVYDEFNNAVPGATVILEWKHHYEGVTGIVTRRSTTRPTGEFLFQGIGKGEHELLATSFDGLVGRQIVDVGSDYSERVVITKRERLNLD